MRPRRATHRAGPQPAAPQPTAAAQPQPPRVYPPPAVLIEKKAQAGALAKLTTAELRKRAKAAGLSGVSKLKKVKLVELLLGAAG